MGNDIGPTSAGSHRTGGHEPAHPARPDARSPANAPRPRVDNGALGDLEPSKRRFAGILPRLRGVLPSLQRSSEEAQFAMALQEVGGVRDAISAHDFIARYLAPGSWRRTDHRAELSTELIQRLPQLYQSTSPDELREVCDALFEGVRQMPGDRQLEPLAAIIKVAPAVPRFERELRDRARVCARLAWESRGIDHADYAHLLATVARSIAFGELSAQLDEVFDEPQFADPANDDPVRTLDRRTGQSNRSAALVRRHPAANDDELADVFREMLPVTLNLSGGSQRDWIAALARIAGALRRPDDELGLVRALAKGAWSNETIDAEGYASVLAMLGQASASADLQVDRRLLDDLANDFERLPQPQRGALYASLLTRALARQPESVQRRCFEKAWEGIVTLPAEHAQAGLAMLSDSGWLKVETKQWIVNRMLNDLDGLRPDLLAPTVRAMAPLMASLPSFWAEEPLTRLLSLIDGHGDVRVADFLGTDKWSALSRGRIFEHMYPIVTERSGEAARANELAQLAILGTSGYDDDTLTSRIDELVRALTPVPMAFRFHALRQLRELAHRLTPQSGSRMEAFAKLRELGLDHLVDYETEALWREAFPAPTA